VLNLLLIAIDFILIFGHWWKGWNYNSWIEFYKCIPEPLELLWFSLDLPRQSDGSIFISGYGFDGKKHMLEGHEFADESISWFLLYLFKTKWTLIYLVIWISTLLWWCKIPSFNFKHFILWIFDPSNTCFTVKVFYSFGFMLIESKLWSFYRYPSSSY